MIAVTLQAFRIALCVIFVISGSAKLLDLPGTRQSLREFGVPSALIGSVALGLPILEVLIAIGLAGARTAAPATVIALALLVAFTAAIAYQLVRGRRPRCNCFGTASGDTVSWLSLVRNGLLLALAVGVLADPRARLGVDIMGWLAATTESERLSLGTSIAALIVVVVLWRGALILRREQQEIRAILDEMRPASAVHEGHVAVHAEPNSTHAAPAFRLPDTDGVYTSLDELLGNGRRLLLLFSDPLCGPCDAVLARVAAWNARYVGVEIVVVSRGVVADNVQKIADHALQRVLLQTDREVSNAYEVHGTPCMVSVGADGRTDGHTAYGEEAIIALLDQVSRADSVTTRSPLPLLNGRSA